MCLCVIYTGPAPSSSILAIPIRGAVIPHFLGESTHFYKLGTETNADVIIIAAITSQKNWTVK